MALSRFKAFCTNGKNLSPFFDARRYIACTGFQKKGNPDCCKLFYSDDLFTAENASSVFDSKFIHTNAAVQKNTEDVAEAIVVRKYLMPSFVMKCRTGYSNDKWTLHRFKPFSIEKQTARNAFAVFGVKYIHSNSALLKRAKNLGGGAVVVKQPSFVMNSRDYLRTQQFHTHIDFQENRNPDYYVSNVVYDELFEKYKTSLAKEIELSNKLDTEQGLKREILWVLYIRHEIENIELEFKTFEFFVKRVLAAKDKDELSKAQKKLIEEREIIVPKIFEFHEDEKFFQLNDVFERIQFRRTRKWQFYLENFPIFKKSLVENDVVILSKFSDFKEGVERHKLEKAVVAKEVASLFRTVSCILHRDVLYKLDRLPNHLRVKLSRKTNNIVKVLMEDVDVEE